MSKPVKKRRLHLKEFKIDGIGSAGALKIVHSLDKAMEAAHSETHTHDYYEIVVILRGEGVHLWEGRKTALRPGSVYFLKPGEYHRYDYGEPLSLINFMFSRAFLSKYRKALMVLPGAQELLFRKDAQPEIYAETPVIVELDILFNRISDEMRLRRPESNLLIELNILNALILLLRCFRNSSPTPYRHSSGIDMATAYMQEHFAQEINLATLARQTWLSTSSFYRKFHQAFGKSPKQWLLELRIRKASEFLLRTDKKIFEVAAAAGFPDPLYFSKQFHQMTGFTPSEYRQREHGDLLIVHDPCKERENTAEAGQGSQSHR